MTTRLLPIGSQDFEDIRKRGCLYVDKTAMIHQIVSTGKVYFLSRPRRFGKSLLISTLDAYFSGKKELFDGLAIAGLEKEWEAYPVIRVDFAGSSYSENGYFEGKLDNILCGYEAVYGLETGKKAKGGVRLENIIKAAFDKTGKQVVVLVDEYDKPILDALYTDHEAHNRELLRDFYSPLKECDNYLKFVFLTGITKVSHINIFSGLNQLNDISMLADYSALCGISHDELVSCFKPEISSLAEKNGLSSDETVEKLMGMYDGYRFSAEVSQSVYNPFCLFKAFFDGMFGSYWFQSGTPTMLVKALENNPVDTSSICDNIQVDSSVFDNYDPHSDDWAPLLYQSGYATIKGYDRETELYTIGFPNNEVRRAFLNAVMKKYVKSVPPMSILPNVIHMGQALCAGETEKVCTYIKALVADIPTILQEVSCENYYESVVHIIFTMTGYRVILEYQTLAGRSDIVVETPRRIYIFELKMDKKKRKLDGIYEEGFRQIEEKGYAARYAASGLPVHKVVMVFSSARKGLVGHREAQ